MQTKIDKEGRTADTAKHLPLPPLTLNPDDYREDVKDLNLTTDQENELLHCVWQMMMTMVDIGWGVESLQLMLPELFNRESGGDHKTLITNNKRKDDVDDT